MWDPMLLMGGLQQAGQRIHTHQQGLTQHAGVVPLPRAGAFQTSSRKDRPRLLLPKKGCMLVTSSLVVLADRAVAAAATAQKMTIMMAGAFQRLQ